ncbi:MAG: hypothetical protein KDA81_15840 [Planctomycetaceae bacterium]|nr:hypothetical protein [Planctomycetaceae bacterium]
MGLLRSPLCSPNSHEFGNSNASQSCRKPGNDVEWSTGYRNAYNSNRYRKTFDGSWLSWFVVTNVSWLPGGSEESFQANKSTAELLADARPLQTSTFPEVHICFEKGPYGF